MVALIRCSCILLLIYSLLLHNIKAESSDPINLFKTGFQAAGNIFKFAKILWQIVDSSGILKRHSKDDAIKIPFSGPSKEQLLLRELKALSAKTDQISVNMEAMKNILLDKLQINIPGLTQLNSQMQSIFVKSMSISKSYDDFLEYVQAPTKKFDRELLIKFAQDAVSDNTCGVLKILNELHSILVQNNIEINFVNILDLLNEYGKLFLQYTKAQKSLQQLLYNILSHTVLTEIKGYLILRFSFKILDLYKGGNYEGNIDKVDRELGNRLNTTLGAFKSAMKVVPREFVKEDPDQQVEGETYEELKNVFQAFLTREIDIYQPDKCYFYCEDYKKSINTKNNCYQDASFCMQQKRCDGDMFDCGYYIENDLKVCLSEPNSTRRYDYIIDGNSVRNGLKDKDCAEPLVPIVSYYNVVPAGRCDVCTCTCADTTSKAERYFNLEPSLARPENNYVVVGARLLKQNHTVHVQVQEGQLLPGGMINATTVRWVPINNQSTDLYTLSWISSREINLDDLEAPDHHVVVGLTFISKPIGEDSSQTSRLHLQLITKPINYEEGIVLQEPIHEITSNISSKNEIILNDRDLPTRTEGKSTVKSSPNQFLKFRTSGLASDAGQTTIPFIDIQPMTTVPPAPLSGAGLYHRSRPIDGGYVSLKLFTYNFEPHIVANMPSNITEAFADIRL